MTILILTCVLSVALGTIAAGLVYIALPTRGTRIGPYEHSQKALLVIDVQEDFTAMVGKRACPPAVVQGMIDTINRVIEQAGSRGIPIIYIRQEFDNPLTIWLARIGMGGLGIKGRPGTRLDPRLRFVSGTDFTKPRGDAFSNPKLDSFLRSQRVNELYLMGLDGVACVNHTAQGALNRGYKVNFIVDGIITQFEGRWKKLVSRRANEGVGITTASQFAGQSQQAKP